MFNAPTAKPRRFKCRKAKTIVGSTVGRSAHSVFHDYEIAWTEGRAGYFTTAVGMVLAVGAIVGAAAMILPNG